MPKTSRGHYFLRNGGTLPRSRRPLRESHDKRNPLMPGGNKKVTHT